MTGPGTLPDRFLDDLRDRVGIADVVGRVVKLTKAGRGEYKGLCPFHGEKTPSFTVSEDKGFFHCFGCQANGDVIAFVQRHQGLGFREAVEDLASRVGLEVPRPERPAESVQRERRIQSLREVLEAAQAWFAGRLGGAEGAAARAYLAQRGFDAESAAAAGLGWAPRGGLVAHLRGRGAPLESLVACGLVRDYDRRTVEVFRERVMIPILDRRGRLVGWGGRVLDDRQPKYLNSPESDVFHKGGLLYGLDVAREAARRTGRLIVVEGYMDVLALRAVGIREAVAPLGTALTEDQMRLLFDVVAEPILLMDGDAAGVRAAARACERALPMLRGGRDLRVASLPPGRDPDDLARGVGVAAIEAVLAHAVPSDEILWRQVSRGRVLDSAARWVALGEELDTLAARVSDPARRESLRLAFRDRVIRLRLGKAARRDMALPALARTPGLHAVLRRAVTVGLTERAWDRLMSLGVPEDAPFRAGAVGTAWVRESLTPGVFQIADPRVHEHVFAAYLMPVLSAPLPWPECQWREVLPEDVVDLVAWDVADPTRWLVARGVEPWLGRSAVETAQADDGPLTLHPTPLDWLRARGHGAVWLPGRAAAAGCDNLRAAVEGIPRLVCADHDHAALVDRALKTRRSLERPTVSYVASADSAKSAAA